MHCCTFTEIRRRVEICTNIIVTGVNIIIVSIVTVIQLVTGTLILIHPSCMFVLYNIIDKSICVYLSMIIIILYNEKVFMFLFIYKLVSN